MIRKASVILLSAALLVSMVATVAGESTVGGDIGYYNVNAGISGASVYFDNDYKGETGGTDGSLLVDVYVTGTPYSTYKVEKQGYDTYSGKITQYPSAGEIIQLSATLEPQMIGGDKGYYKVVTNNVAGASVYLGSDYKGLTEDDGTLTVEVYTTGTPYTTYKVEKAGYTTYDGKITEYPAEGQIVELDATLDMVPVTAPTTAPTQSPFPVAGVFGLAALGAFLLSRRA
ncbi:hypothetical protein [Methanogenium organophilum]|uniref:PEGA domain-containing protein n=1 Tax=Methanogenium organophilum TaxID=2199 RepID=A0A9X9S5M1_METOG|nr:hypothetical protein [Methanogenium organophilum]WAI02162.1 hypothetical protein OU421_04635 [Methanogenium organophilum]